MSFSHPELYRELRAIARRFMSRERVDHTLSPTDLFHEAYTRLAPVLNHASTNVKSLPGLFAITMRRILIDHARKRARKQRKMTRVGSLTHMMEVSCEADSQEKTAITLLELDQALTRLAAVYPVHAQVVEMKFFGGMTVAECAEEIGICRATTQRYWNFARAWIARELDRIELE
jgi:RNA polymerase sigma-70 factor (ECF subfamily)